MIRLHIYHPAKGFTDLDGCIGLADAVADGQNVVWVDLEAPTADEMSSVAGTLQIPRILLEDAAQEEDRPRLRRYNDVLAVVFHAVRCPEMEPEAIAFASLRLFLSPRYVVTVADERIPEMEEAYFRWQTNTDVLEPNTEAPMYTILDTLVDGFFPIMDAVADRVDEIEDLVVDGASGETREAVFVLKRALLRIRRVAAAGRDVVNSLVRHDDTTPDTDAFYLRDVYDHLNRITDAVDIYRDLLSNVMDAYLSVMSNRLNVIMQTLTSWSIILGAATLVTSLYGMNTDTLPGAHHPYGFQLVLALCLVMGGLLFGLFRRKRWI